jgi:hypothetical protein
MPPPLAPPGSPICSSPCIHHSRSGSDPFWMSLVASVASQDLHSRHLHSVWAALGLPHRHKVSALTPNWFRPLRWAGQDSCRGASSRCHICCWHIFLLHPGQPRTRAKRPDPSRRRIRTPDPDCCKRPLRWVVRTDVAGPQQMSHLLLAHFSTAPRATPNQGKQTRPIKTPHTHTRPRLLRMGDFGTFGGQLLCCRGSTLHWLP